MKGTLTGRCERCLRNHKPGEECKTPDVRKHIPLCVVDYICELEELVERFLHDIQKLRAENEQLREYESRAYRRLYS